MKRLGIAAVGLAVAVSLVVYDSTLVQAQPVASIALPPPRSSVQLYAGCNNIALSFPNGTASQTVVQAVTPAGVVQAMWRHNAAQNRFEGFSPAAPQASDLLTVNLWDAVWLCVGGTPPTASPTPVPPPPPTPIPPPSPAPPQTGPTPAQQQAIFDQYSACADAWGTGAGIEASIQLRTSLELDTSYEERQFQMVQTYVSSNCVGIGVRLASIPGIGETSCFIMLANGSGVSGLIEISRRLGYHTYFWDFAKREIDGFLAAARC